MPTLKTEIKKNKSRMFRRALIKRRDGTTGLFESNYQDISSDVKQWGSIKISVDAIRPNKIQFSAFRLKVDNSEGKYNPEDDDASLWFGFASRERSLLKIEAGFIHQTLGANGIWTNTEFPTSGSLFIGLIQGDMPISDDNEVSLNARPLLEVFREFPAQKLTGYTSTGLTASQFIETLRDQTDGAGAFVFRPFFDNTTSSWNIQSTTNIYTELNTSTGDDIHDKNVWEIIEILAESEQFIPYIDGNGIFNFKDKTNANTSSSQYSLYGRGSHNTEFGHTIKKITKFGKKHTRFYPRVTVQHIDSKSITSFAIQEASLTVSGTNDVWNFGFRTLKVENFWIPTSTVADSIATALFNEFSAFKNEIDLKTTFIPSIEILDRIDITYQSPPIKVKHAWDLRDWAINTDTSDLIWDNTRGDAINIINKEFKVLSVAMDINKFENTILAREL